MPKNTRVRPLMAGVMSGTSADGIDVAIVRICDHGPELVHYQEHPMPAELKEPILRLADPGMNEIDSMGGLDVAIGRAIGRATLSTIETAELKRQDIAAIGSSGQTIRHRPQGVSGSAPFTLQIGCPSTITEVTGITTVADFRRRDIAAGGEGAPLTPFVHRLLLRDRETPAAILNIGGIANVTFVSEPDELLGFDTGPGNMVMDGLMLALTDGRHACDRDGSLAAAGRADETLLKQLLAHPFFSRKPPKSCGREEFGRETVEHILAHPELCDADRLRTALELTIASIRQSTDWMPTAPDHWYVYGGGTNNSLLMRRLAEELLPADVSTTSQLGMPPEAMEASAFATLAWNALKGKANTLTGVTGANHAVCGGHIVPGANWPDLIKELSVWIH
ncbi:MAG: anhydro-N-acetylmuramic acid kinase [Mariprofundaceae bacterium]